MTDTQLKQAVEDFESLQESFNSGDMRGQFEYLKEELVKITSGIDSVEINDSEKDLVISRFMLGNREVGRIVISFKSFEEYIEITASMHNVGNHSEVFRIIPSRDLFHTVMRWSNTHKIIDESSLPADSDFLKMLVSRLMQMIVNTVR